MFAETLPDEPSTCTPTAACPEVYRDKVRRLQITPRITRRGTGHGSGLGVYS
ncbi:hypothetical protein GCM10010361_47040 [Streptomyces olivaceiscleroticus]|uniref:Uncharacterized protein n=1 Tax=Streptomyces olivaceiscleroticus TaxID=68245 RepID=A0ABN1AI89_9ACTN